MENLQLNEIIRNLHVLDFICAEEETYLSIAIFGGASLIMHLGDENFRSTMDIDYKIDSVSSQDKLDKIKRDMPGAFEELGMFPQFPDHQMYKENGKEYHTWDGNVFTNLKIFLPSIEMIALSKLMSDRGKDLEDLMKTPIMNNCDLGKLKEYVIECKTYLINTRQFNFHEWDDILLARGLK